MLSPHARNHFNAALSLASLNTSVQEYQQRRQQVIQQLPPNSVAVIATAPARTRNRDAEYAFRPDSSFYYLTGFAEPEAILVLSNRAELPLSALFCRKRDPEREQWDGLRVGVEAAPKHLGVDVAFAIEDVVPQLSIYLNGATHVYTRLNLCASFDQTLQQCLVQLSQQQRMGKTPPVHISQLDHILDELRLFKRPAEIERMQKAAEVSAMAHTRAMQCVSAGMQEYQLAAELTYVFAQHGMCEAYNSIVAGGANACILHYTENNQTLHAGDLVLIDAGAELDCYAADITRTFPVSGRFSAEQAALYNVVLNAQLAAIASITTGARWHDPHHAAVRILVAGLIDLKLLTGRVEEAIETGSYKRFYMHRTGHWLGMDVHDVGLYHSADQHPNGRLLQSGMVFTVEPGLYIHPQDMTVDAKWRGIGIRIEDDVYIDAHGAVQVLTSGVPKRLEDIEQLMQYA